MIYLNNAATTYPKPQCVQRACAAVFHTLPAGQFRSAGITGTGDIFSDCQKKLGTLLGIRETENIHFTSGATEALNKLIYGLNIPASRFLITATEHNSVLRPLYNMLSIKGKPLVVPCEKTGKVRPETLKQYIAPEIRAVMINHCSNVTGCVQDMAEISRIVKEKGLLLIVDISQSAGCIPVDIDAWRADATVFTGHKSLFGIQGSGGYYIRSGIPFRPMFFGGSGRNSEKILYGDDDYEYDVGTQNSFSAAALHAAAGYVIKKGVAAIQKEEQEKIKYLYETLSDFPQVILYGNASENKGPVFSFNIKGLSASDTAYILQNGYDIITRAGLHCAPLIHPYIGSEKGGTVRVSISDMTTWAELEQFTHAVKEISQEENV